MRTATAIATVVMLITLMTGAAHAQDQDTGITLTINPTATFYGGSVTISGAAAIDARKNNRMVTARFSPPQGETFLRQFDLTDAMTYSFTLTPVTVAGEWTVKVQGPVAQLGTAEGTFTVYTPAAFASTSVRSLGQGLTDGADFTSDAEDMTEAFTELPDKDAALEKMSEVKDDLAAMGQALGGAAAGFDQIADAMSDLQMFPELTNSFESISGQLATGVSEIEGVRSELKSNREEMNNAREHCRRYHFQKYGFKLCSKALSVAFTPGTTLGSWAKDQFKNTVQGVKDKLADEAVMTTTGMSAAQVAKAKAALAKVSKGREIIETHLDPEKDFTALKREAIFAGVDWLIDWIYSKVGKNCRMYQADIKGKLRVEYYTKGMVYMVAQYPITGEMKVFFKKREGASDIVKLTGQVQGSFGWRTGMFYPERTCMDVPGMTGVGFCVPRPPFMDYLDFVIKVEGEGKPDGIELQFDEVLSDIDGSLVTVPGRPGGGLPEDGCAGRGVVLHAGDRHRRRREKVHHPTDRGRRPGQDGAHLPPRHGLREAAREPHLGSQR